MKAVLGKLERLEQQLTAWERVQAVAVVLALDTVPPWAEPLDAGRCLRVVGGDRASRRAIVTALHKGHVPKGVVVLEHRPGTSRFIVEVVSGEAFEVACWGARGDRKTSAALTAIILLADLHRQAKGALPYRVMVPTGSHAEHVLKLCRTVLAPHWGGLWALRDDKHLAVLTVDGEELAQLDLFGAGDVGGPDRLRMEAHALWAEEVAPAALEGGGGVSEDAIAIGSTSLRMPTRRPVVLITSNLPEEDAWVWQRFEVQRRPGTVSVRIPPGESASAEDRARWAEALTNRPDLALRLLAGEPGSVIQGPQVAKGYSAVAHVAPARLEIPRAADLVLGWDSAPNAHTHATIIGQRLGLEVRCYACLVSEQTGLKQHLEATVLPWLARRCPWALERGTGERLFHAYDPMMDTAEGGDIDMNPVARIRRELGGSFKAGAVSWPGRAGPMLALLNLGNGRGGMALQIDPGDDTAVLRKALSARWHYAVTRGGTVIRDLPAKPNHPWEDAGDSFCYWAGRIAPSRFQLDGDAAARSRPTQYAASATAESWRSYFSRGG